MLALPSKRLVAARRHACLADYVRSATNEARRFAHASGSAKLVVEKSDAWSVLVAPAQKPISPVLPTSTLLLPSSSSAGTLKSKASEQSEPPTVEQQSSVMEDNNLSSTSGSAAETVPGPPSLSPSKSKPIPNLTVASGPVEPAAFQANQVQAVANTSTILEDSPNKSKSPSEEELAALLQSLSDKLAKIEEESKTKQSAQPEVISKSVVRKRRKTAANGAALAGKAPAAGAPSKPVRAPTKASVPITAPIPASMPASVSESSLGSAVEAESVSPPANPTPPPPPSFIYVAMDGDAAVFHPDLMIQGRKGGWLAGEMLVKALKNIFGLHEGDTTRIVIQAFLNIRGHTNYLWSKRRIHADLSTAFFEGLNEADPLINVVNVGARKEAADAKVRDGIEFHVALRDCSRVALAGVIDAGYCPMLRSIITRGLRHKLVLLNTKDALSVDIKMLTKQGPDDKYGLPIIALPADLFQQRPATDSIDLAKSASRPRY